MNYTSHSPSPPSPASIRRRELINELSKGHRAAEILRRRHIRAPSSPPLAGTDDPASDSDLAEAIWNSFNASLSIVKSCDSLLDSRFSNDCKIEDSSVADGDESASRVKDRRGCYKRRKRGQSWTQEGEAPIEDGHQWRKYGQKMILNSQFPRNYYRCTHKTDQGCQAVKQVQKTSDDPTHYKTIYSGIHTCKSPNKTPQIIIPSPSPDQSDSSFLLSFDRTSNNLNNAFVFPPSHNSEAVKQEQMATNTANAAASQAMMMMMPTMMNPSSSSDYNYLSSTPVGSDHGGDVISIGEYSCSASPHSLEIDNYILGQEPLDLIQFECDDIYS